MTIKLTRLFLIFFVVFKLNAQSNLTSNQEKISNSLISYFNLERENIHLHLNKKIYLTNEEIWFKGYIIENKNKTPFIETTNVYLELIDENNKKIFSQLCFADNSIFEGHFKLNKTIKTGRYFIKVFTNFMNNFSEDESSIFNVTIINPTDDNNSIPNKSINLNDIEISFFPESGNYLTEITNTIGIRINDCNYNGIEVKNIEIFDTKNNIITNFSTNKFGFGKFSINPNKLEYYTLFFNLNGNKIEKKLPLPDKKGISFSVENYVTTDKTILKVKTNSESLKESLNNIYTIVIQQNEACSFIDFSFKENNPELIFNIPNEKISFGINTIYLIDSNLNKLGERIIYKPYEIFNNTNLIAYKKSNDSIAISGTSKLPFASLSISILPSESISENNDNNIFNSLIFDNYLSNKNHNILCYLNDPSRKNKFELDNFLLTQKSKYDWNSMMNNPPQKIFDFDKGLTVKGTINSDIKTGEDYKINMNSIGLGLNEITTLNKKNEFLFEHVIALDSTKIYFTIINKKGEKTRAIAYSQILNNNRNFTKPFLSKTKNCNLISLDSTNQNKIPFPIIKNSIILDSVTIITKKNKLVNEKRNGNYLAKGFKISDKEASRYRDILQFINNNGYTVSTLNGNVTINGFSFLNNNYNTTYNRNSVNGFISNQRVNKGPAVFIDDTYIQDYNILRDYGLNTVDEIYINRENNGPTFYNTKGTIKIYSKKSYENNNNLKNKSQSLIVKNGFQQFSEFQNPKYDNVKDIGFKSYGTIDWKQNIITDENGNFIFSIPNLYQSNVKIIIEGINNEGQLISTTNLVEIP